MSQHNNFQFSALLDNLKTMDLSEIETEYKIVNNLLFHFIKSNETIVKNLTEAIEHEIHETILRKSKYKELELVDDLFKDLKDNYTLINEVNAEIKIEFLKKLSNKLVYKYYTNYPENEILKPINTCIIKLLKKIIPQQTQLIILIDTLLEIELKYIGQTIKNIISKKLTRKENSIIENTMHILISSSSDRLGNLVNVLDDNFWFITEYALIEDLKQEIKNLETPMNNLKNYLNEQSKLFKSFKNEINQMTPKEFYFMIDFIFKNGFKIKYPKIHIEINKNLSEIKTFSINEYLLINSMYALIENSIEASATEIQIKISNSSKSMNIEINDNGVSIPRKIEKYITDKNFSYNKPGHFGLGLYIAKNWLESVSSKLEYVKEDKTMKIVIPLRMKSI